MMNNRNTIEIRLTQGALDNGYLNVRSVRHRFPPSAFGGSNRSRTAHKSLKVWPHGGECFESDIAGDKCYLRSRANVRQFYQRNRLKAGDRVRLTFKSPHKLTLEPSR